MKLPDLNVLLYAVNPACKQHEIARTWLEQAFNQPAGVGLAWITLIGFLRLSTRTGIFPNPLPMEDALQLMQIWLNQPQAQVLHPSDRHAEVLGRLLLPLGSAGNLTTDAHLAALAIEHGATLGTFDRDFSRFGKLKLDLLKI